MADLPEADTVRIAIIAVHGVGDQQPCETPRAVAALLGTATTEYAAPYTSFAEEILQIPVQPLEEPKATAPAESGDAQREEGPPTDSKVPLEALQYRFMQKQCQPPPAPSPRPSSHRRPSPRPAAYQTIRLRGRRDGAGAQTTAEIHLYELFWADLSRLRSGLLQVFVELFQLLFHLGTLGRQTIRMACEAGPGRRFWSFQASLQAVADWTLALWIPLFDLFLLAALLVTLPGKLEGLDPQLAWVPRAVGLAVLAMGSIVVAFSLLRRRSQALGPWWLSFWPLPVAAGLATVVGLQLVRWVGEYSVLAILSLAVLILLLWHLLRAYDRARPGVMPWAGWVTGVFSLALGLLLAAAPNSHAGITGAALQMSEMLFLILIAAWLVFDVAFLMICLLHLGAGLIWQRTKEEIESQRSRRVARTARVTLAIPAALYVLVTFALWTGLNAAAARLLPDAPYKPRYLLVQSLGLESQRQITESLPAELVNRLIEVSATPAFPWAMAILLLAAVFSAWGLAAGAWADLVDPRTKGVSSVSLGVWLTKGFRLTAVAGEFVVVAMALVMPLGGALYLAHLWLETPLPGRDLLVQSDSLTRQVLGAMGTVLAGSAVGLLAFRGRLEKLALGFRGGLDRILDVDQWLREYPLGANPRKRIIDRYVSLLHYLSSGGDLPDRRPYQAVLILSHSQGSVITADLLRFLKQAPIPKLADYAGASPRLPIYLMTFGCPLRQLYSLRFPHLYGWVRDERPVSFESGRIPKESRPDPSELLGVRAWLNAYFSGDYIGRYLWRPEYEDASTGTNWKRDSYGGADGDAVWRDPHGPLGSRREFCLGAGSHNHYLDGTSPDLVRALDDLIREAVEGQPHPDAEEPMGRRPVDR